MKILRYKSAWSIRVKNIPRATKDSDKKSMGFLGNLSVRSSKDPIKEIHLNHT